MTRHRVLAFIMASVALYGCDKRREAGRELPRSAAPPTAHLPVSNQDGANTTEAQRANAEPRHEVTITRDEYGEAWPFTVDSGVLRGTLTGGHLSNGSPLADVTFATRGKTYGINGLARAGGRFAELTEIWAEDSSILKGAGLKTDMAPIIRRGLRLAGGVDEPFVPPKAVPEPSPDAAGPIHCNQFDLSAVIESSGASDARRVRIQIKTDLPDATVLMVGVDRLYANAANGQNYPLSYFDERSTVGDWRAGRVVEISQGQWQAKLDERRAMMRKLEEGITVTQVDSFITVDVVVPINQEDKRFGLRNANLIGSAVLVEDDMRIVRKEARIEWPVTIR